MSYRALVVAVLISISLIALVSATNNTTDNYFVNPGFEWGNWSGWDFGETYYERLSADAAHTGSYGLYHTGGFWNAIFQYVNLTDSQNITFWAKSNDTWGGIPQMNVIIGKTNYGWVPVPQVWTQYSYPTYMSEGSTIVEIWDTYNGHIFLDDFNLTPREHLLPIANFTPVWGTAGVTMTSDIPVTIQFNDTSSNSPTQWNWSFGDGYTSNSQNPSHIYEQRGHYNITLTVTNPYGTDSITKQLFMVTSIAHKFTENAGSYPTTDRDNATAHEGDMNYFYAAEMDCTPACEYNGHYSWYYIYGLHDWSADRGKTWYPASSDQPIYSYNEYEPSGQNIAYLGNHILVSSAAWWSESFDDPLDRSIGRIARSTDDGQTWTVTKYYYPKIYDDDYRIVNLGGGGIVIATIGYDGRIYMSIDYGATGLNTSLIAQLGVMDYVDFHNTGEMHINNILYLGNGKLILSVENFTNGNDELYTSLDSGFTWNFTGVITTGTFHDYGEDYWYWGVDEVDDLLYLGNNTLLATDNGDRVLQSTNMGVNWSSYTLPDDPWLETVVSVGNGTVIGAGEVYYTTIFRSDNYGVNWTVVNSTAFQNPEPPYWTEQAKLTYTGNNSLILSTNSETRYSPDLGYTWDVTSSDGSTFQLITANTIYWTHNLTGGTPAPVTVQFMDNSTNSPTAWNWSFGDGTYSEEENPVHTYTVDKTYSVTLTTYSINEVLTLTKLLRVGNLQIGGSIYFTPHKVRFVAHDYLGKPIVGMNVSVIGVESSLGSLDWIPYLFGINLNNTPLLDTQMNATTGSDGAVAFILVETEKYELHYVDPSHGIDEKRYYYPKEEEYLEVFWTESPVFATPTPAPCGAPVYSANAIPNTTGGIDYMDLRVNYSDCSAQTSNMTFYVTDVSNNKVKRTLFTNATVTPNSFNLSYVVPATQGSAYKFGVNGRTFFGSQIYQETLITINQSQWRANFLNADDGDAAATWIYNAVAIALVSLLGYLFGKISMKAGVVVVPLIMAVFSWMGWLQTSALIVSVAVVLGVMFYLRYAEQEAGL